MQDARLELGAVFKPGWGRQLAIRVIAFDKHLAMYDSWLEHKNAWRFASRVPSTCAYLRVPTDFLLANATYLRTEPYPPNERAIHRPDLPFAVAQFADVSWYDMQPQNQQELAAMLPPGVAHQYRIPESPIYLCPFGPKDGIKRGARIDAEEPTGFTVTELIWAAWMVQKPLLRKDRVTAGIGIYRSGLQAGHPSYYIWGAKPIHEEPRCV